MVDAVVEAILLIYATVCIIERKGLHATPLGAEERQAAAEQTTTGVCVGIQYVARLINGGGKHEWLPTVQIHNVWVAWELRPQGRVGLRDKERRA